MAAPQDVSAIWRTAAAGNRPTTARAVVQSIHRTLANAHTTVIAATRPGRTGKAAHSQHMGRTLALLVNAFRGLFTLGLSGRVRRGDPPPPNVDISNSWAYYLRPYISSWHTKRRLSLYQQQSCAGNALHPGLPPTQLFRSSRQLAQAEEWSVHLANPSWPWTLNSPLTTLSLEHFTVHSLDVCA